MGGDPCPDGASALIPGRTLATNPGGGQAFGTARLWIAVGSAGHGGRGSTGPDRLRRLGGFPGRRRHAAELFAGRPAVLATVWEPGLGAVQVALPGTLGMGTLPPDPATIQAVDRLGREHASTVVADGAEFARSLGLVVEPQAIPDEVDVADTLIDIARERGAAVVVVGSHGISGLRKRLLGSVSRKLVEHCDRPVLVIRDDSA
jgi:nucleotide-binding universal stress UspA family protein